KFPKNFSAYHRKFYIEDGEVYEYS
ncbi:ABC transporter ATP-binding protein, partial [Helicobacter pylori]